MTFKLTINMDNAAFEHPRAELRRIFAALTRDSVDEPTGLHAILDTNGNRVGEWEIR